ncbi:MAG: glycoside hydrolase family 9 protein [Bacteroidales bacterium]|nr:glycoside hydrolase family 9 protein [Bacteroidales bacterium]
MKSISYTIHSFLLIFLFNTLTLKAESWIRVNQMGYQPASIKVAIFISDEQIQLDEFQIVDFFTDEIVFSGKAIIKSGSGWGMSTSARLDFSSFKKNGLYILLAGSAKSPIFRIAENVYEGSADFILQYMRQQRCGYNPYFNDSCHIHDGFIVDHPTRTGEIIDVTGGWHDASDYLQYLTTSANAVYQMLLAYQKHPEVYDDKYNANGLPGANNIPDILDEAKWGLDWMLKMNPDSGVMFNQIADDRDHSGYRLPTRDSVSYGKGLFRPVYFITGKTQGLAKYKNRTTGVSSSAGKFSSSFAIGAKIFEKIDSSFANQLKLKAIDAFEFASGDLGVTQTACNASPYFYEEDNYVDDLELASWELFSLTNDEIYLKMSNYWGNLEPVTPWMEKGAARHYQYYPFVNLGHAHLAEHKHPNQKVFEKYLQQGLKAIYQRGKDDLFFNGIPFIWCSNNLLVGAITQAQMYFQISGDSTYCEMEAALRDWLFGCNPWGTSMICGLPEFGVSPQWPHSSITFEVKETTFGGLVDGPVYKTIFENLRGVHLSKNDEYSLVQNGKAVYHDDMADYSSNEPTMDGTASLSFYLSYLEMEGNRQSSLKSETECTIDKYGALVRKNNEEKKMYLIFSADEYADGFNYILEVLKKKNAEASFFLTGNFLRNKKYLKNIGSIIKGNHYLGAHSDKHLLYNSWEKRDSTLISQEEFINDMKLNYKELSKFGIQSTNTPYFLPPYEWYNQEIVKWTKMLGLKMINFTPGIGTSADYTTPDMKNYKSSEQLYNQLIEYEQKTTSGLNGVIILIHPGTHPDRKDKFYLHLENIIDVMKMKGYKFKSLK